MMYEVEAKCGHVGRSQYVLKSFPVVASSAREAAKIARDLPRVKHDHRDAIRNVRAVDTQRYWKLVEANRMDPYFQCRCIQEQRARCTELVTIPEIKSDRNVSHKKEANRREIYVGKQKIRDPKKYLNKYYYSEEGAA